MSTISVYVGRSTARLIPLDMALVDLLIMKNSSPEDGMYVYVGVHVFLGVYSICVGVSVYFVSVSTY